MAIKIRSILPVFVLKKTLFILISVLICSIMMTGCRNDSENNIKTETPINENVTIHQADSTQWDDQTKEYMAFYEEEITQARS